MLSVDVLLIHPPYQRRPGSGTIPPLGLAYIAAALEAEGRSVAILDCALDCHSQSPSGLAQFRDYLARQLPRFSPRCAIGIGPTTTPALKAIAVLAEVAAQVFPHLPLIYGGPFASLPSQIPIFFRRLGATALIRGDGDEAFPALVKALQRGDRGGAIPGVAWNEGDRPAPAVVADLDRLPFPARHLLDQARYQPSLRRQVFAGLMTPIYGSRGCPYQCSFCLSPLLRDRRVTRRSRANLFAEMRQCVREWGIRGFIFYDDCLFLNSPDLNQQVQAFARELIAAVGEVIWEMELRCDAAAALAPESWQLLAASGCRQINLGIEKSANPQLAAVKKQIAIAEVEAACRQIQRATPAIRSAGTFILGGPGETEVTLAATLEFAIALGLDFAHFYPLAIYPETPLFERICPPGGDPTAWATAMLAEPANYWGELLYATEELPAERLLAWVHRAYAQFYGRSRWREQFAAKANAASRAASETVLAQWQRDRFHLAAEPSELPD